MIEFKTPKKRTERRLVPKAGVLPVPLLAFIIFLTASGCRTSSDDSSGVAADGRFSPERIILSPDRRGFATELSGQPFHPWGLNYGHSGRLMEDFWEQDWPALARDFREMKTMGANVVRLNLQFGKFMSS